MSHSTEFNSFWDDKTLDIRSVFGTKGGCTIKPPGLMKILPPYQLKQETNKTFFNDHRNTTKGEPLDTNPSQFAPNAHHSTIKIQDTWSMTSPDCPCGKINKKCTIHKLLKINKEDTEKWYPFIAGFDNAQCLYYWILKTIQLQSHFHFAIKCKLVTHIPSDNQIFIDTFPGMLENVPIETDPAEIERNAAIAMQSEFSPFVDEFVPGMTAFMSNEDGERTPSSENNTIQQPLMFNEVNDEDDEEEEKDDSIQGILISMGFGRDLVEFIIKQNPDQNDISLLVELCITSSHDQFRSTSVPNQQENEVFTPRTCHWTEVGNFTNIHQSQVQQNQHIQHKYNAYNSSNIQTPNENYNKMKAKPTNARYEQHADNNICNVTETNNASNERVIGDGINSMQSNDINLDCTMNTLQHQLNESFESKEFAILNLDMQHEKTQEPLYGIITIHPTNKDYKYQLIQILTPRQIYDRWNIEAKYLPKPARDSAEFKNIINIKKNTKLLLPGLKRIAKSRKLFKYVIKTEYSVDNRKEVNVIKQYLKSWKPMDSNIEIHQLIPILYLAANMSEIRIHWVYFVKIPSFGYDIGIAFGYNADGEYLEFVKIFLDLQQIKDQHKLLGDKGIKEMETRFNLKDGYYERLLSSKTARSEQMDKTKACLQFDEELKTDEGIDCDHEEIMEENKKLKEENKMKDLIIKQLQEMIEDNNETLKENEIKKKKKRYLMVQQIDTKEFRKYIQEMEYILDEKDLMIKKNEIERQRMLKENKFLNVQSQKYKNKFDSLEKKMFMLREENQDLKEQIKRENELKNNKGKVVNIVKVNNSGRYGWRIMD